jgi:hypothetical protein
MSSIDAQGGDGSARICPPVSNDDADSVRRHHSSVSHEPISSAPFIDAESDTPDTVPDDPSVRASIVRPPSSRQRQLAQGSTHIVCWPGQAGEGGYSTASEGRSRPFAETRSVRLWPGAAERTPLVSTLPEREAARAVPTSEATGRPCAVSGHGVQCMSQYEGTR